MLVVFEMYVRPGFDETEMLDEEARQSLSARVMTRDEAIAEGLELPPPKREGEEVRYLPVNRADRGWVERAIEGYAKVSAFDVHEHGGV